MRAWLSRSDFTSAMISSLSFLYLRSCAGVSASLLRRSAMSWSCNRRRRLYSLATLSKVSSTLGLSSASIAASDSEPSISSSSKSASGAPSGFSSPFSWAEPGRGGTSGHHDRLAVGADRRWPLGVWACVGRPEIDDVAQEDLALVELVAPDDDGLEGERALAQARDHGLAAGLDALGDGDFALAREQFHRAHFAQIHA